jgi:hypothetical protein
VQHVNEALEGQLDTFHNGFGCVTLARSDQRPLHIVDNGQQFAAEALKGKLTRLLYFLLCTSLDVDGISLRTKR